MSMREKEAAQSTYDSVGDGTGVRRASNSSRSHHADIRTSCRGRADSAAACGTSPARPRHPYPRRWRPHPPTRARGGARASCPPWPPIGATWRTVGFVIGPSGWLWSRSRWSRPHPICEGEYAQKKRNPVETFQIPSTTQQRVQVIFAPSSPARRVSGGGLKNRCVGPDGTGAQTLISRDVRTP
jgi:hypothetical protein